MKILILTLLILFFTKIEGELFEENCEIFLVEEIQHQLKVSQFHKSQSYSSQHLSGWMKYLNDSTLVSELSIPGTHDTGTFRCNYQITCYFFQCQSLTIYEQLTNGIRYLDLRINSQQPLTIGHQTIEFMSFEEALTDIKRFLDQNPEEFLILAFQRNLGIYDPSIQIRKELSRHKIQPVFEKNQKKLTVGSLRGKVWIFSGLGIDFENETFLLEGVLGITDNQHLYLQNFWYVFQDTIENKTHYAIDTAFEVKCQKIKANFMSGSVGISPFQLSVHPQGPNLQMLKRLSQTINKSCLGIMIMDYPRLDLIASIIQSNVMTENK